MIAPLAITLALAFWAPYNHGEPVCPNGVQIVYDRPSPDASTGWVEPQDMAARDCRFHVRADIADQTVPYQCMIVAHELGHAAMGLPDDPLGPPGIMNGPMTIPGACYPPRKAKPKVRVHKARHVRSRRRG